MMEDEELLKQLIALHEKSSQELNEHIKTLAKIGGTQESINRRLDYIENFLDKAFGGEDDEEERIIN